jgi:hypothetical protein
MTSSQGASISLTWTVYRLHRSQEPWGISQFPNLGPVWTEAKSMPTRFCWNFSGQTLFLPWFLTRRPHDCQVTWLHRDVRNHFQSDPIWCYPILTYLPIYLSSYLSNLSIYIVYISTYGGFSFCIFENWVDPLDRDLILASMGLTHLWWNFATQAMKEIPKKFWDIT